MSKKAEERRERRAAARRNQILDAAAEVFAEKGFARATTKEIADRADVSEGTIYNYFESKLELLLGLSNRLAEMVPFDGFMDLAAFDDPADVLRAILQFRYAFNCENEATLRVISSEIVVDPAMAARYREQLVVPIMGLIGDNMRARIEVGQLRPVDASSLSLFLSVILTGSFIHFALGDLQSKETWDALSELIVDVFCQGVIRPAES
jgi:AcrR family transcriptional regulator